MESNILLKQLLLIGVGTTTLVADKLKEVTEQWVQEGRLNPAQATAFVDDLMQKLRTDPSQWETQMQRQLANMMQDLGLPQQSEMNELRGRIDRLERQVRDLENKTWR